MIEDFPDDRLYKLMELIVRFNANFHEGHFNMFVEERVIVFDEPGTTRDSIYIPFERSGKQFTLIDTAGMRRRSRVSETIEKFTSKNFF